MKLLFALLTLWAALSANYDPRNADVPAITTMLEQGDGSRIALRYRAVHWGSATASATDALKFSMINFTPTMGTVESNVQIKIGQQSFDPGRYDLGLVPQNTGVWLFVISKDGKSVIRQPVAITEEPNVVPHLSFVFRPGVTNRDFIFSFLYGNLSTSFRWTITGVPSRTVPVGERTGPMPGMNSGVGAFGEGNPMAPGSESRAADGQVSAGTEAIPLVHPKSESLSGPSPNAKKKKPGSGAFRRMLQPKKEENQ
ncbi:MAG: hypothetical protein AB1656_04565 [Candidatus Omnitrophota bacterium]